MYSDGLSVAAGLERLAAPGEFCHVYDQIKDRIAFCFEPTGEDQVKNIPESVTAYPWTYTWSVLASAAL